MEVDKPPGPVQVPDDPNPVPALLPFTPLPAEEIVHYEQVDNTVLVLTNFRVYCVLRPSAILEVDDRSDDDQVDDTAPDQPVHGGGGGGRAKVTNLPLGLLEYPSADKTLLQLSLPSKEGSVYTIPFPEATALEKWLKRIEDALGPPKPPAPLLRQHQQLQQQEQEERRQQPSPPGKVPTEATTDPPPAEEAIEAEDAAEADATAKPEPESPPHQARELLFSQCHFSLAKEQDCDDAQAEEAQIQAQDTPDALGDRFRAEMRRLEFNTKFWRVTYANEKYRLCPTYPQLLIVPTSVTDNDLFEVAPFRGKRRLPSIVWRNVRNGMVLARCAQPEIGLLFWRNARDENMIESIGNACDMSLCFTPATERMLQQQQQQQQQSDDGASLSSSLENQSFQMMPDIASERGKVKTLIMDLRSYTAAMGNRARGGGTEAKEYYKKCEITFCNLPNIHAIRQSFHSLRQLCSTVGLADTMPNSFLNSLEHTRWMLNLSHLLATARQCARALTEENRPVVVHCSDGWDRTSQVTSLAQLLLDPHYRTVDGFETLVQREWLDYGHKFADRCGNEGAVADTDERSPIFVQWLDCVHQLLRQFPVEFQFTESYLIKLALHAHSGLFGTFVFNCQRQRRQLAATHATTRSVWRYLRQEPDLYLNPLYKEKREVLAPSCHIIDMFLWKRLYCRAAGSIDVKMYESVSEPGGGVAGDSSATASVLEQKEQDVNAAVERLQKNVEACLAMDKTSTDSDVTSDKAESTTSPAGDHGATTEQQQSPELASQTAASAAASATAATSSAPVIPDSTSALASAPVSIIAEPSQCPSSTLASAPISADKSPAAQAQAQPQPQPHSDHQHHPCELDRDGLLRLVDPVQQRLVEQERLHNARVNTANQKLLVVMRAIDAIRWKQYAMDAAAGAAVAEELYSREMESQGQNGHEEESSGVQSGSIAASEASSAFEAIEQEEAEYTKWVPDHLASRCMRCNSSFSLIRRKHHCRACGNVLCSSCTKTHMILPEEYYLQPVRVCDECADKRKAGLGSIVQEGGAVVQEGGASAQEGGATASELRADPAGDVKSEEEADVQKKPAKD